MYPQYGDARYPAEFGPGHSQMPMNPSAGPMRYGYPVYYSSKGPDSSQFGGMSASQRAAQQFGGKPGAMVGHEGMYGHGWSSAMQGQAYLGPPGTKPHMGKPEYPYAGQPPTIYSRMAPVPQGYPESMHHLGIPGYPGVPAYGPSPHTQYSRQYAYSAQRSLPPPGMPPTALGAPMMDGYHETLRAQGMSGMPYPSSSSPWPTDPTRRAMLVEMSRGGWPPQDMVPGQHPGSWTYRSPDGYLSTPAAASPSHTQQSQQTQPQQQDQQAGAGLQMYRQQGQQSFGSALSPQTPYSADLQKQPSVSSLRDALLSSSTSSAPQQQQQPPVQHYSSPRPLHPDAMNQPSPMTPSANLPATPDASTPTGGSTVMSPQLKPTSFRERQDSTMSAESELLQSLSRQNSDAASLGENPLGNTGPARVSPFQVESILGIKDDKPIDSVGERQPKGNSEGLSMGRREGSAIQSPQGQITPFGEHHPLQQSGAAQELKKQLMNSTCPDSIPLPQSPVLSEDGTATRVGRVVKTPVMSPVDRSHPSIMSQYNYSDDQQRKEFLDALFSHLEKEGIPLVHLPTICKVPLDLYKAYSSVQQLGGFVNVMEKRLWRDVLKSFNSSAANPNLVALRTLQQYYTKVLLPYECYVNNLSLSELLSKFENSRRGGLGSPSSLAESERANHADREATKLDSADLHSIVEGRVNGESQFMPDEQMMTEGKLPNSQEREFSGLQANSQKDSQGSMQSIQMPSQDSQRRDGLEFPEGSQNSVDSYSQGLSSTDQLPDISVQEAESLLGMSPSPYPTPEQPPGGPGTPTAQLAPSPSYPPSYTPQGGHNWSSTGTGSPDYMSGLDMNNPSAMTPTINPPAYPPSYPMDPTSGYRPHSHPQAMLPGYPSYSIPSQPDMPPMQSPMMRSPYPGAHYPVLSPSMQMVSHRPMDSSPYSSHYRSPMLPQHGGMNDMPYPGMGMPPDWHWQQRSRFPSHLPPHMQSPSYQKHMHPHSTSPRPQIHGHQQAAMLAAMQHHRSSPGHLPSNANLDPVKIRWQDQRTQAARMLEKSSSKPMQRLEAPSSNKGLASKPSEPQSLLDSLKRPLPDWRRCVEGTRPQLVKRRRLFSGDCGHVEPWRVMMSLKSGLLAESTWALDTLNILLHDDRTVGFFYLKHHHSLLNTLVDHFRKTLVAIFGDDFADLPKYISGHEESDEPAEEENGEAMPEWLSGAHLSDYNAMSKTNGSVNGSKRSSNGSSNTGGRGKGEEKGTVGRNKSEEKGKSDAESEQSSVPRATIFTSGSFKLGRSDDMSHIQLPRADEKLYFPSVEGGPEMLPEGERRELQRKLRLQRIDETPVSELLQREAVLHQIPLHRFGRLGKSPRRREKSFFEEIRLEQTEDSVENSKKEATEGKKVAENSNAHRKVEESPKLPEMLKEESEIHQKESLPLWNVSSPRELLQGRCMCISNILRSLSFIPGNDLEYSQHSGILVILGRLLTLHHNHLVRRSRKLARSPVQPLLEDSEDQHSEEQQLGEQHSEQQQSEQQLVQQQSEQQQSNQQQLEQQESEEQVGRKVQAPPVPAKQEEKHTSAGKDYWWWDCLEVLRENSLVILSNISGQLDLSIFQEAISYPIINGLIHWAVCPSAHAVDPLPDTAMVFSLSPQRLVLEALAKMSISEANVDFILATPPLTRLDLLFAQLIQFIGQKKHPVMRQFALVLLSNLAQGSEVASRLTGQQKMVVSLLLECIETSEHASCASGGHLMGGYNPDDPNSLSVAMLRRAATTLHCLSKVPANRTPFLPYRDRLLYLATSQYVEPSVSSILMDMLFELGKL